MHFTKYVFRTGVSLAQFAIEAAVKFFLDVDVELIFALEIL